MVAAPRRFNGTPAELFRHCDVVPPVLHAYVGRLYQSRRALAQGR